MGNTIKKYLKVEGMHCSGCEKTIINILLKKDGIFDIEASVKKGLVFVSFDEEKQSIEKIVELIEIAGYKVKEISDTQFPDNKNQIKKKEILNIIALILIIAAI